MIVIVHIPFFTGTIEKSKEIGVAEFICFREIAVSLGRVAFFGAVLIALTSGWNVFAIGFAVAAAACLLFLAV